MFGVRRRIVGAAVMGAAVALAGLLGVSRPVHAAGVAYSIGDVLVGAGNGKINEFSPTGTLLGVLDTTTGGAENNGMCFDSSLSLFATNFSSGSVSVFNQLGALTSASFGSGYNLPESCVVGTGDVYVGNAGVPEVLKLSSSGALLASYNLAPENKGADWIDLASDQCTMYYTSEGPHIKRFNVCTNTQMKDFADLSTNLAPSGQSYCFANRLRANGETLVACGSAVYRLNASGTVIQTYSTALSTSLNQLFALDLDPDGTTFWTADDGTGIIYHVDIATGNLIAQFGGQPSGRILGLAVVGAITQSSPSPSPSPSPSSRPTPAQGQTPTPTAVPTPATVAASKGGATLWLVLGGLLLLAVGSAWVAWRRLKARD